MYRPPYNNQSQGKRIMNKRRFESRMIDGLFEAVMICMLIAGGAMTLTILICNFIFYM